MKTITVLLADDHPQIRNAWKLVLSQDRRFTVVGEAISGEEAIAQTAALQPQVVLLDCTMHPMSGFDALPRMLAQAPQTKVIGLSSYAQPVYARRMLALGAHGCVTKNSSADELVEAIVAVSENKKYICRELRPLLSDELES